MGTPGRDPTVADDEILDVFYDAEDPVLSTREVANAIGIGRRGSYSRLENLATDGPLQRKKFDNKLTVWWLPDALRKRYADDT